MKKLLVATLVALFGISNYLVDAEAKKAPAKTEKKAKKEEEKSMKDAAKDAVKDKANEKLDGLLKKF